MSKKSKAPFWSRVGSAFENGWGDEGWLAKATYRIIAAVVIAGLMVVGIIALPFIALEKLAKKFSGKTSDQTPQA